MEVVGQTDPAAKSSLNLNFAFDRAIKDRIVSEKFLRRTFHKAFLSPSEVHVHHRRNEGKVLSEDRDANAQHMRKALLLNKGMFRCQKHSKIFVQYSSHRIFGRMHGALNIDKRNN
jgi:hypothetical protein